MAVVVCAAPFFVVSLARMLRQDLEAIGIEQKDSAGRIADFHTLRHTFVTMLARSGVHPNVAQKLARHSSIGLTMMTCFLGLLRTIKAA